MKRAPFEGALFLECKPYLCYFSINFLCFNFDDLFFFIELFIIALLISLVFKSFLFIRIVFGWYGHRRRSNPSEQVRSRA